MYNQKVEPFMGVSVKMGEDPFQFFRDLLIPSMIIFSLFFIICLTVFGEVFQPLFKYAESARWGQFIVRPSVIWSMMGSLLLVFRTLLWLHYKPFVPSHVDNAPSLTVVIPAYNEGPMVEKSIDSVVAAKYPREKLEVIVVDDGSKDDTWQYIKRAALRYPRIVKPIRFRKNKGKRSGLKVGFEQAKGEIVVTIDSDSVIEEKTLLAMVGPFRDPRVGAVAGKVAVYNKREGIIPRMLHVQYTLSFDVMRAAQSTYGAVY